MSNTSVHNMETFLIKLKEEYCVYEHMLALCMQERQCIAQGDWHELRKSLGKRNVLLADVVRIEEEITELQLKEEWGTYREEASAPLKDEILSLLENFKKLIENVVTQQQENETLLYQQNVKKGEALSSVRKEKNLNKAYAAYGTDVPPPRYMDKKK